MIHERFHPGPHPDADQLNAFVENALNQRERQEALAHLAECAECRSVVSLAREPLPPVAACKEMVPWWQRWLRSLWVAGPAFACGLLVLVFWHGRHSSAPSAAPLASPEIAPEVAREQIPPPVLPGTARDRQPPTAAPKAQKPEERATLPPHEAAKSSAASSSAQAVPQALGAARPIPALDGPIHRNASPAPAPPPAGQVSMAGMANGSVSSDVATDSIEQLPLNGRNTAQLAVRKKSQSEAISANGPVTLSIEHNHETADGLSEITGSVLDPSGAVVPGATITWRRMDGTSSGQAKAGADGHFTLAALPAGSYTLQIASPGFEMLSQRLELQARDLAMLRSTLQLGSTAQTVEVSAAAPEMSTNQTSILDATTTGGSHVLPSQQPVSLSATSGTHRLAVDAAGTLFFSRNGGKHWKAVKPQWPGKIANLSLADRSAGTGTAIFQLTTEQGAVWLSDDGMHWHAR